MIRPSSLPIMGLLTVVWVVGLISVAYGQDTSNTVGDIRTAYRQLEYQQAEHLAREALASYSGLTLEELEDVHRLLALIEISQGNRAEARRHFEAALSLNAGLELDAELVSPKILAFFEDIKRAYLTGRTVLADSLGTIRYRLIPDPRSAAALRSLLLPGWGQLYKGEAVKGGMLMGVWGVSVGGAVAAHLLRNRYRKNHPGEVGSGWNNLRNSLLAVAAGAWLVSYLDALLTPVRAGDRPHISVSPTIDLQVGMRVRVSF